MLPLLALTADGLEHSIRETREQIAGQLGLTDDDRAELLPSGRQPLFDNRLAWAKTYLQQAGLLNGTRRAHFAITDRGQQILAESPAAIDVKFLNRFPEFVEFRNAGKSAGSDKPTSSTESCDTATSGGDAGIGPSADS